MTVENSATTTQATAPTETSAQTVTAPATTEAAAPAVTTTEGTPNVETKTETQESKTLLGAEPKVGAPVANTNSQTEAAKTAPTEQNKEQGKQSDEPAPLPTYQTWKLSEGVKLDDARMGEFNKELAEFQVRTKADHAAMQEFGQKLIDRHVADVNAAVQSTIKAIQEQYDKAGETQRNSWKELTLKDPDIGGNRQETTIRAANEAIKTHGGTAAQQKEFRDLMEQTGLGNHPAMIRMLANVARNLKEGKPLPASKPESTVKSAMAKRYGAN